jgi:hypothetical protein
LSEAPPSILLRLVVKLPECINKSIFDKLIKPLSFFWQEARNINMAFRIVNVNPQATDVKIS